jgi:superfamily II DNA or RNA helicase
MNRVDRFIASCPSWEDFWQRTRRLSKAEMGRAFERLVQLYLQTEPEYRTILRHVWTLREVPAQVRKRLELPHPDEGIDLIALNRHGEYWAIQAKFRSERDQPLTRRELGTFTSLAFNTCRNIARAVVAHTCTRPVSKRHLMRNTFEIGLDRWQSLDWGLIVGRLEGKSARPKARHPRPHQARAISAARDHFVRDKAARGRLIMPCGTGKSLAAYWIAEALKAKTILVAVPSLALIRQGVTDWTREFLANAQVPDWLCVCSDESVGNLERDEFVGEVYELGLPTHTDPKEIASLLRAPGKAPRIVFTTYQSSDKLAAAARLAGLEFDLAIFDEAHKTVGVRSKTFATLLRDRRFKARYCLFMTATERVFRGDSDEVLSMDNEEDYGKRFFHMSFKEAISQRIISDYKILTIAVSDERVARVIEENRILNLHPRDLDEAEARAVATGVALKRVEKQGVTHAISFHSSIRAAERFRDQQDVLNRSRPRTTNLHISSKKTAGQRADLLREFEHEPRALMTNARCLTEGVDVPAIDCVVFAAPKRSRIDIVQAAGRALRVSAGKEYGYILLPLVVPRGMDFEKFAETTAFREVVRIVAALSTQDERIADEFRAIQQGRIPTGKIVEIEGDVPVGMHMSLREFSEAISTRIWESVGRANFRTFEDARAFVRRLGLKTYTEWRQYASSGEKPHDIPYDPYNVYAQSGWAGWGDWLGTGAIASYLRKYRSFKEARAFVRRLGLKSHTEWQAYCRSGKKPSDIPNTPHFVYVDVGWSSWGDWLGTGSVYSIDWRPFNKARAFVHSLGLKSGDEWRKYCTSGRKPSDIPSNPNYAYAQSGWSGMGDWLGTGRRRGGWQPFKKARAFVRRLDFNSHAEWRGYCKSDKRPRDIPHNPDRVYADAGWSGWGDWLGTATVATRLRKYRSFKEARAYARRLGLNSFEEWRQFSKTGQKPQDIPSTPSRTYANAGWFGWGDWLGTKTVATRLRKYRSFTEARAFVRSLGLKSQAEWREYVKSNKKPVVIPNAPGQVYAQTGWAGWGDWLGTGTVAPRLRQYQPFKKARAFARSLGLKSQTEWIDYSKSGKKPHDVPAYPNQTYAGKGWAGMGDWLGTSRVAAPTMARVRNPYLRVAARGALRGGSFQG